ncbi:uncharacterized protein LOC117107233 [Anneissia japonica]|uniref:uncharacterized protein LOC117107233 n=1 Tax=Anneissia japonica TaxID=1529436 RepID=UPI00142564EC|nr:uncharacterized protein LOC117107233 [Anneissia japonica]XP_033104746.1 uncharacterized protein LOC117107233 [Anneissia japonica]
MVENTIQSIDSSAYRVNLSHLDENIVIAHNNKERESLRRLLLLSQHDYYVFLCVNDKYAHAFVLCVTAEENDPNFELSNIPDEKPCWKIHLAFESMHLRRYKIYKEECTYEEVKDTIDRRYYVGKYNGTSEYALDLAAVEVAPHRYNALLNDCMEFAKKFCIKLSDYCNNEHEFKDIVKDRIRNATATGYRVETVSRRVQSSAITGHVLYGGADVSSFLYGTHGPAVVLAVVIFLLIYPILVTVLVVAIVKYYSIL